DKLVTGVQTCALPILDTHIWLWWVNLDHARMKPAWRARIESTAAVGVSAISCFEMAWLAQHGRIILPCPRDEWFEKALDGSGIRDRKSVVQGKNVEPG